MQRLRIVSVLIAALAAVGIVTGVRAYSVMTNVWPESYTTYKIHDSINTHFGAAGVARVREAAEHWTNGTIFAFNRNDDSLNEIGAGTPLNLNWLAVTYSVEDALGIYRSRSSIVINTSNPNII